jgi:endonuclease/exonuclease/phosphatase (EEP) superfamily protein YafD
VAWWELALEVIGWATVAVIGGVMLTEAIGWTGTRIVATLQALTPLLALLLVPVGAVALWQGRYLMAVIAGVVGLGALILMAPLVFRSSPARPADDTERLRVGLANLLYGNERIDNVVADLAARDLDVIVFNEYTPEHQTALLASVLADGHAYKIDRSEPLAGGIAIWSRQPFTVDTPPSTFDPSLDVTLDTAHGPLRVIAVHPRTPVYDFTDWRDDLRTIGQMNTNGDAPILLIGDFNATYWNPGFRDLLNTKYVDAHIAAGRGFSASWPTDSLIPPFVRLDHALTTAGLVSTDVDDFDIPGSDHRGFVVTVAPTR